MMLCTDDDGVLLDFKAALLNTESATVSESATESESLPAAALCHIGHEPLTYNHITLQCGHTFNYIPLYKELCAQRSFASNRLECPYCRAVQQQLLPYVPLPGVQRVRGVNNDLTMQQQCQKCKKAGYATAAGLFCENHHQLLAQTWTDAMLTFMLQKNIPEIKALLKEQGLRVSGTKKELVLRYFLSSKK